MPDVYWSVPPPRPGRLSGTVSSWTHLLFMYDDYIFISKVRLVDYERRGVFAHVDRGIFDGQAFFSGRYYFRVKCA